MPEVHLKTQEYVRKLVEMACNFLTKEPALIVTIKR